MITAVYILGGLTIFWGIGLRLEPGTTLRQSGAQTNEPRYALYELRHTLSQATFSNVAAHLCEKAQP
jgi:hypothetical protein